MPVSVILNTTSTYNNGLTDKQVKPEITNEMSPVVWNGDASPKPFLREFNLAADSPGHLGAPLGENVKITMLTPSSSSDSGSSNGNPVANIGQSAFDKMTGFGKTKKEATSYDFQSSLLKAPSVIMMPVGAPKTNKGRSK